MELLGIFIAVIVTFVFLGVSLTFARYKKRTAGCCSGDCKSKKNPRPGEGCK